MVSQICAFVPEALQSAKTRGVMPTTGNGVAGDRDGPPHNFPSYPETVEKSFAHDYALEAIGASHA